MERFIVELRRFMPGTAPPEHPVITRLMDYISENNGWNTRWKSFVYLCAGAMLNFRSGGIGRITYLLNNLEGVYHCYHRGKFVPDAFTGQDLREPFCNLLDAVYRFHLDRLGGISIRYLWPVEPSYPFIIAHDLILRFQEPRFQDTSGERRIFHSKSFWIPRELKRRGIWPDFPPEFCCVPDQIVRGKFFRLLSEIPEDEIKKNPVLKTYFQIDIFRNARRLKGKSLDMFKHYALREITQKTMENLAPRDWGTGLFLWSKLLFELVGKDKNGLPNGLYDEPLFFWRNLKKQAIGN
ncbi:MAG: hypothetical protein J7M18_01525 [Candidatus Eremiobacteraeota bacterium]|nr:hypothetical protein [Candidatus Eremiobacteraeota bacterium]